jgi:hypothetical protein
MKIIGITGRKRHGKGEVGNAICQFVPGAKAVGYADKLKISVMRALGFARPEAELIALADSLKVDSHLQLTYHEPGEDGFTFHDLTGRQLLQWYGTEGGRETFGDTFWIDQVLPKPSEHPSRDIRDISNGVELTDRYPGVPVLAITDLRFDNEAQRVLAHGGEVWNVVRPGLEGGDSHASEAGVRPNLITRTIDNSSTLDHLAWRVECALELAGVIQPS